MDLLTRKTAQRGWTAAVLALLLLLLPGVPKVTAEAQINNREYSLKAVFLYNFCQFIDWPPQSFTTDKTPFVIGVLGSNPFGSLLSETVEGEMVRGRGIRLEYYKSPAEARNCHLLFISDAELARHPGVFTTLNGHSVVTVGESDTFLDKGGMIALTSEQNKIRVRIFLQPVSAAKVEISSKLLRIADIRR
ncbi:YfiR family protein [Prosthecobacter sp. SYSU 5D2]|uniref:YfiR family protein n=1 Tax=Prosthecobacter sp. SYSU 5D2 TaxID=3134134 RepID=UPI0031FF150C